MLTVPDIDWIKTYTALGMGVEFAEAVEPLSVVGEHHDLWVVPIVRGINCDKIISFFREMKIMVGGNVGSLSRDAMINDRDTSNGSYVVGFAREVEGDEYSRGSSADKLTELGCKGITLLERLLLGLGYFLTTGRHLDVKNVTLCLGSRLNDGRVAYVHFVTSHDHHNGGWYNIHSCKTAMCAPGLRSRFAVSLTLQAAHAR
jgi:hypothetical protein